MISRFPTRPFISLLASIAVVLSSGSAWAADPFRTGEKARPIGPLTAAAFQAVFQQGNYPQARQHLEQALRSPEVTEPLVYTLLAGLAFNQEDWPAFRHYASQTRGMGERLVAVDPLRGHLYHAVGYFLEASFDISSGGDGLILGLPKALLKVQQMFTALDKAAAVDPKDPELNLIKGYLDLALATELALLSPNQVIQRFQDYAAPAYLAHRGIAIAYRDLKQHDQALMAVDQALLAAPENPELLYLKAQILRSQGKKAESVNFFDRALARQKQLPASLVQQINRERNRT